MGLTRVVLNTSMIPQEYPLSRYQNMGMVDILMDAADLHEVRSWLMDRGIDTKVEMYKVKKDRRRYIRCVLYADMDPEMQVLMNLTFDRS